MPTMPDCYRILGVSPRDDLDTIKRRFRLLALKFHPDRNPRNPQAAARFREVAEAYASICQTHGRRRQQQAASRPQAGPSHHYRAYARQAMADFFAAESGPRDLPSYGGPDFRYDLQIPFLVAMRGTEQDIAFQCLVLCRHCQGTGMQPGTGFQDCPTCQGRGRQRRTPGQLRIGALCEDCQGHGKIMSHPCPECQGLGYRMEWKKYRIRIPSGIEDGTRLLFRGEGGEGFAQGPRGHLVVVVHVEPHSFYTRHQNDLYGTVVVSLAQALWGDTIEIPTPWGVRYMELPRGSRSGQSFLFPGLGVPGNGRTGDLIITIEVQEEGANHFPDGQAEMEFSRLGRDGS
jgi:molecular chaperone DnaJ